MRLSAWNNMGGYLDGLSLRTEEYREPQQQQDMPSRTDKGYEEQSQYAQSLSMSSTDTESSGWSSAAWQQQYDALQRKNGNLGSFETEAEVDDAVVMEVIEKHSTKRRLNQNQSILLTGAVEPMKLQGGLKWHLSTRTGLVNKNSSSKSKSLRKSTV